MKKNVPKESTAKVVWKGVSVTKHIPLVMPQRESACVWLDGQEDSVTPNAHLLITDPTVPCLVHATTEPLVTR